MSKIVGELVAGIGVGFVGWKTIGSEVRSCLHVSDPSSLALAFSQTNFQVQPKILPQKCSREYFICCQGGKKNESQLIVKELFASMTPRV